MSVLLKFFSLVIYCFLSVYPAPDATINFQNEITINLDNTGTITETMYVSKAAVDACDDSNHRPAQIAALPGMEIKMMDGIECYVLTETKPFSTLEELRDYIEPTNMSSFYEGAQKYIADPLFKGDARQNQDAGHVAIFVNSFHASPSEGKSPFIITSDGTVKPSHLKSEQAEKWFRSTTTWNIPGQVLSFTCNSDRGYDIAQEGSTLTAELLNPSIKEGANAQLFYRVSVDSNISKFPVIGEFIYYNWEQPGKPATFTDVTSEAWYGFGVSDAYRFGLMDGVGNRLFAPNGTMTLAEACALAARIHSKIMVSDLNTTAAQGSPWYQPYVDYLTSNGIISTSTFPDYTRNATRGEMAYLFSRATPDSWLEQPLTFNPPDVSKSNPYYNEIIRLYHGGIFGGSDIKGTFNSDTTITRGEVAAIVTRIANPAQRLGVQNDDWLIPAP